MDTKTLAILTNKEFYSLVHEQDEWLVFNKTGMRTPVIGKTPEEALQKFNAIYGSKK